MNLIFKVFIIAVVLIVAIVAARYTFAGAPRQITALQAESNITNYITTSYPGADVSITGINQSQYAGSWHIVASVIVNGTRACPSYYVYSFDYPQYGFVSRLENNYTANCVINGLQNNSGYIITSAPIAIVRSYDFHLPSVAAFIQRYGYSNVNVSATYFNYTSLGGTNYSRIWLVQYSNPLANHTVDVAFTQSNATMVFAANGTS